MAQAIYSLSNNHNVNKVMNELVIKPYIDQSSNLTWQQEVISQTNKYHRISILNQGAADFTKSVNGLTPEQTTLLYTYIYGPMHIASNRYLLDECHQQRQKSLDLLNHNTIVVDFGCGPLTFGLSMAWYNLENKSTKLQVNYIGIDSAPAMLNKAKQFSQHPNLFTPNSKFSFLTDYTDYNPLKQYIQKYTQNTAKNGIILNFSYFFASASLDPLTLVNIVNQLVKDFPTHRFSILFQNPNLDNLNIKWNQFKSKLSHLFKPIVEQANHVNYSTYELNNNQVSLRHPRPINLYYEVLVK